MERMEATLQLQQALGEAEDAAVSMEDAGKVPGSFLLSLEVARGLQGSSQQEGELPPALALEPGVSWTKPHSNLERWEDRVKTHSNWDMKQGSRESC